MENSDPSLPSDDSPMDQQWFIAYQELGGEHDFATFKVHLQKFFDMTSDAFVSGLGSRQTAWRKWSKYIGSRDEADRYFQAVDSVTAYT